MTFVSGSDAHVVEPKPIFDDGLPASLKPHGIRGERPDRPIALVIGGGGMGAATRWRH